MSYKYSFNKTDFLNGIINPSRLSQEIGSSAITIALDHTDIDTTMCDIWFKAELSSSEQTTLSGIVIIHTGQVLQADPPIMDDGRPIVRSDTRPLGTQTYFTMAGDTVSGIGDGAVLRWDFSEDTDWYDVNLVENGPTVASGLKAKKVEIWFNEPIYVKDGTLYFIDATFGTYLSMYISVPAGNYYPNDAGEIPASALGLSGDQMYAYATNDVFFASYVMKHHMIGDCTMGDELNAEGAQIEPIPAGWCVTGLIAAPEDNNSFKGFGALEMYRPHTVILPGGALGGE